MPFHYAGRTGLFLHPDVAILGELFAWFADGEWRDERFGEARAASLEQVVQGLSHQFGAGSELPDLRRYLEDWRRWQLRGTRPVSLVGDYYRLLAYLGSTRIDPGSADAAARIGAWARFSQVLADFEHVHRRGRYVGEGEARAFRAGRDRGKPYYQQLHNYLLHYARDAYEDFDGEESVELDAVEILTVHQAKGLEWPVVFLPALVEGRFPSRRSGHSQQWLLPEAIFPADARARHEGSEVEERRLFYVALTRARECVYLSCFERRTNRFRPSPYLQEIAGSALPRVEQLPLPEASKQASGREPDPVDVSFSDLAAFEECGYHYRLGQVFGFQQELAVELGYGRAIHHVLRQVAEAVRAEDALPSLLELESMILREFFLPFADAPAFQRMIQAARRLVRRYVDDSGADLMRLWAVERPFELAVLGGRVNGSADLILDREGGRPDALAVVDYKLANDPIRDDRYRRQLAIYTAAGRGEGLHIDAAWLHDLKDGGRHAVDVSASAVRTAVDAAAASVAAIRAAEFAARPLASRCGRCDFRPLCRHAAAD